jgi:hypothetical protein
MFMSRHTDREQQNQPIGKRRQLSQTPAALGNWQPFSLTPLPLNQANQAQRQAQTMQIQQRVGNQQLQRWRGTVAGAAGVASG